MSSVSVVVNGKKSKECDKFEADMLSRATHFTVLDCSVKGAVPVFIPSYEEAVEVMKTSYANKGRKLVYGFHYIEDVSICFEQVLLTPMTVALHDAMYSKTK
jgi:hypothetical protein